MDVDDPHHDSQPQQRAAISVPAGGTAASSSEPALGLCLLDTPEENGWTALHYACSLCDVTAVRVLIENGASVHSVADDGRRLSLGV